MKGTKRERGRESASTLLGLIMLCSYMQSGSSLTVDYMFPYIAMDISSQEAF